MRGGRGAGKRIDHVEFVPEGLVAFFHGVELLERGEGWRVKRGSFFFFLFACFR